ncbi:MAG: hypothetical protein ACRD0D_10400, partial [Acidimicrobiales bacterium]
MPATVVIRPLSLPIVPGGQATCEVHIRNTGGVVEQFAVVVLGEAAPWAKVAPASVSLFPDQAGSATVTFAPPKGPQPSPGSLPFAVKVVPENDPAGAVVEEGALEVGRVDDVSAELLDRVVSGR